mgnify:CR=1 FL=1
MNDWYKEIEEILNEATECIDCVEEQLNLENQCMEYLDKVEESNLDEGGIFKKVIRKGKVVRKKFCKAATQKALGGRCVPMKGTERMKRKRALKRSKAKKRGKMKRTMKKIRKAMRKRKSMGLK